MLCNEYSIYFYGLMSCFVGTEDADSVGQTGDEFIIGVNDFMLSVAMRTSRSGICLPETFG